MTAWGQTTTTGGNLTVTVSDPSGANVAGAVLEVRDPATNDTRHATTQENGIGRFLNLPGGTYSLSVSAKGFSNEVFESVLIQTSLKTAVKATLKLGTTTESITVNASETPLVQTESSALSTNFDSKQIFNLPQLTRNTFSLVYDTPGYASGTFNNLPGGAVVAADFDGTQSMSNRFRDAGYAYGSSVVDPRIENIAELTVTTSQMDLGGNGTSAMRISIVTKRGANDFHGLLFEDFRNTVLNANSWSNNANVNAFGVGTARSITKFNNFGGNIGGPIRRNKLFFFGTFSEQKNPNTSTYSSTILNPLAQQGIYQYLGPNGAPVQVNLFQIAQANGLPTALNSVIKGQLSQINGVLSKGNIIPSASDPNVSSVTFTNPSNNTIYYPTVRLDYNATEKLRLNLSYTQQKTSTPLSYTPNFPGIDSFADNTSYKGNNKIIGLGAEYTVTPTLFNNLRLGYLYQYSIFDPESLGLNLPGIEHVTWGYGTGPYSGSFPRTAISSMYSMYSINDTATWLHGKHSVVVGFSGFREWDRYWNGPGGWSNYTLGINSSDPAYAAINAATQNLPGMNTTFQGNARSLYATLVGDISSSSIAVGRPLDPQTKQYKPYGQYNLNEVQQSVGFWIQDRWKIRPDLTLNYGLRWDIVGDDHDKDGAYTSANSLADIWGPTPVGSIFQPGATGGIGDPSFTASQHKYNTIWKNPEPAVAFAWNPTVENGFLGKLLGHNKTVFRGAYSLRNYQDGAQNIWAFGSEGLFFYQQGSANPDPTLTGPGYFKPGSLYLGSPTATPAYLLTPTTWASTIPGDQVFGQSEYAINPHIRLPYVQEFSVGIQRQIGQSSALEIRYVGNFVDAYLVMPQHERSEHLRKRLPEGIPERREAICRSSRPTAKATRLQQWPRRAGGAADYGIRVRRQTGSNSTNRWTGLFTNLTNGRGRAAWPIRWPATKPYVCNIVRLARISPCAARGSTTPGATDQLLAGQSVRHRTRG